MNSSLCVAGYRGSRAHPVTPSQVVSLAVLFSVIWWMCPGSLSPIWNNSLHKCLVYIPFISGMLVCVSHSLILWSAVSHVLQAHFPGLWSSLGRVQRHATPSSSLTLAKPGEVSQQVASALCSSLSWVFYKSYVPSLCVICFQSSYQLRKGTLESDCPGSCTYPTFAASGALER